jgi:hypothetical protein
MAAIGRRLAVVQHTDRLGSCARGPVRESTGLQSRYTVSSSNFDPVKRSLDCGYSQFRWQIPTPVQLTRHQSKNSEQSLGNSEHRRQLSVLLDNRTGRPWSSSEDKELHAIVRLLVTELTLFGAKIPYREAANTGGWI